MYKGLEQPHLMIVLVVMVEWMIVLVVMVEWMIVLVVMMEWMVENPCLEVGWIAVLGMG